MISSTSPVPDRLGRAQEVMRPSAVALERSALLKQEQLVIGLCFITGAGALGAPLARSLWQCGGEDFVVIDRSEFSAEEVGQECTPEEVGDSKASVIAQRLRNRDAWAIDAPCLAEAIRSPLVRPEVTVIVDAGESPHSAEEIGEIARDIGVPLFRIRIDPMGRSLVLHAFRHDANRNRCPACDAASLPVAYRNSPKPSRALIDIAAPWAAQLILAALEGRPTALRDGMAAIYRTGSGEGRVSSERTRCLQCENGSPTARANAPPPNLHRRDQHRGGQHQTDPSRNRGHSLTGDVSPSLS